MTEKKGYLQKIKLCTFLFKEIIKKGEKRNITITQKLNTKKYKVYVLNGIKL